MLRFLIYLRSTLGISTKHYDQELEIFPLTHQYPNTHSFIQSQKINKALLH